MSIKSISMQERRIADEMAKCRHIAGGPNHSCSLGINVRELVGGDDIGWVTRLPCRIFCELRNGERVTCESQSFLTREEAIQKIEAQDKYYEAAQEAFVAVHADALARGLGKPTRQHPHLKGGRGEIRCPVCKTGTIRYSVAQVNGHIHAACSSPACVRWIE